MYNEPKRDFFFLLIISALLHLIVIVIILLSKIDDSVKEYKHTLLKAKEKKEKSAQVIFQQPPEKKREPKKKMPPLVTAGVAAPAPEAPTPPVPAQEPEQPALPEPQKEQEKPKEQPQEPEKKIELEEKKEIQKKLKHPEQKRTKITEPKKKPKKKPEPERPKEQSSPQPIIKKPPQPEKKKKLTLADIAKGFMDYARNTTAPPSSSNHAVTVIGAQAGKATAEQLRYERYAAKLFRCIQASITVLLRKFRFIHRPDVQELALNFVMDIDAKGNIAGLTIRQSTGNQQFDTFMINVLRHASKSFPPLPAYFKTDICSFPIIYTVPIRAIQMAALSQ